MPEAGENGGPGALDIGDTPAETLDNLFDRIGQPADYGTEFQGRQLGEARSLAGEGLTDDAVAALEQAANGAPEGSNDKRLILEAADALRGLPEGDTGPLTPDVTGDVSEVPEAGPGDLGPPDPNQTREGGFAGNPADTPEVMRLAAENGFRPIPYSQSFSPDGTENTYPQVQIDEGSGQARVYPAATGSETVNTPHAVDAFKEAARELARQTGSEAPAEGGAPESRSAIRTSLNGAERREVEGLSAAEENEYYRLRASGLSHQDAIAQARGGGGGGAPAGPLNVGQRVTTEFGDGLVTNSTSRSVTIKLDSGEEINVQTGTPGFERIKPVEAGGGAGPKAPAPSASPESASPPGSAPGRLDAANVAGLTEAFSDQKNLDKIARTPRPRTRADEGNKYHALLDQVEEGRWPTPR